MDTSAEHVVGADTGVAGIRTRKRRSVQEKLLIVRETLQSGASVAVIARRHGVNTNRRVGSANTAASYRWVRPTFSRALASTVATARACFDFLSSQR